MKVIRKEKSQLVLRFEQGEEYPEVFIKFLKREKIRGGFFFGLGAFENPTVAYFDLKKKEYIDKSFKGVFEVLSLVGNVAVSGRDIIVHEHAVFGDKDYRAIGGHLIRGTVGGTLEIHFTVLREMKRKRDNKTKLNLLV
ncbi:MAG: DUF296 domain-containing protein [Patescibacteria group bacterium]|nr:DUF296 domain-containing protein [Patescibacteria group bacterium]